ncbi:MAG: putative transporter [Candidatus Aminicenantes bacterium]|nr:putative transporter [Candidatus Aminicenantes bacterium]
MSWLVGFFANDPVGHALFVLCLITVLGQVLGSLRVLSIRLGVAGILFVGLVFGHFGASIDPVMSEFARDLGLVLFVYSFGQEVGPGLLSSLKRQGGVLNLLAASTVLLGGLVALLLHKWGGIPLSAAAGLFSGATTNTPSLAAVQQSLKLVPQSGAAAVQLPSLAYAMAYPFGIIGVILVMGGLRLALKADPHRLAAELEAAKEREARRLASVNLEVRNPELDGLTVSQIVGRIGGGVVISRLSRGLRAQEVPRAQTKIRVGDRIHAVGPPEDIARLRSALGVEIPVALTGGAWPELTYRSVVVTRRGITGKTVQELDLRENYGLIVTRILRTGQEFAPRSDLRLEFGDELTVVGKGELIDAFAKDAGESGERLSQAAVVPMFIGIALGVALGSLPIKLPGSELTFRIGLAGGPLIVAVLLSRIRSIGPLVWHVPPSANHLLRTIGISLFLAAVGIRAGAGFVDTLLTVGVAWILGGALITLAPILLTSLAARVVFKVNFLSLCGLLAGSMTNPPALVYANSLAPGSDEVTMSFVTVYPLTMLLRLFVAQALILFFI